MKCYEVLYFGTLEEVNSMFADVCYTITEGTSDPTLQIRSCDKFMEPSGQETHQWVTPNESE